MHHITHTSALLIVILFYDSEAEIMDEKFVYGSKLIW